MESFSRSFQKMCGFFALISAAAMALMIVSTTLDTTIRYTLNFPIPGVFELSEVLMVIIVFLGITWTQAERGHTRITMIIAKLPIRRAVQLDMFCWAICLVFLAILGLQTGKEALKSYQLAEFRWGSVQMPIWWAKALVPLGCWLTCIQLVIDIWVDLGRLRGKFPLDLPDIRDIVD
ncbi:MAG: TRAP transporter small permease [Deltaproteobacteria bacterium]|nr:TRAP transporter small permease [Deltaproteobacteria bacterium]